MLSENLIASISTLIMPLKLVLPRVLRSYLSIFSLWLSTYLSQKPANRLIWLTAKKKWKLLSISFFGNLFQAFSEGATLAVLYVAVELLSGKINIGMARWASFPIFSGTPPDILFVLLLLVAVLLQGIQSLSRYLSKVANGYFSASCRARVTAEVHRQIMQLSYPCSSTYKVGDLISYANGSQKAVLVQVEQSNELTFNIVLIFTYMIVMIRVSPVLLVVSMVMAGFLFLVQYRLLPKLRHQSKAVTKILVKVTERITEDFQALRLLHTSGQRHQANNLLKGDLRRLDLILRQHSRTINVVEPLTAFLPILTIAIIASVAVLLLPGGTSGVLASLVTFIVALQRLNSRVSGFNVALSKLVDNSAKLDRLNDILNTSGKQFCREGGCTFTSIRNSIDFIDVDLQYRGEPTTALNGISFNLQKGQMVALVGPSGAGKSSIADLLVGLYSPTQGKILIDDQSIDEINLNEWQHRIGVVSQDTFLLNATLSDNISFGSNLATQRDIEAAAVLSQADKFINELPQGYNTMVGERGYRLSGGQRQRIALARAILKKPELLILDEATSALDSQSERLVQEALEHFDKNYTLLVIAHRLSTIVKADQILVLNHGRIIERGTHAKLLELKGLYRNLWDQQNSSDNTFQY